MAQVTLSHPPSDVGVVCEVNDVDAPPLRVSQQSYSALCVLVSEERAQGIFYKIPNLIQNSNCNHRRRRPKWHRGISTALNLTIQFSKPLNSQKNHETKTHKSLARASTVPELHSCLHRFEG